MLRVWKQKHGLRREFYASLTRVEADDVEQGVAIYRGPILLHESAVQWALLTRVVGRVPK